MKKSKYKVRLVISLDSEDYPIPSDGNVSEQLIEDITEAIQTAFECEILDIEVKG